MKKYRSFLIICFLTISLTLVNLVSIPLAYAQSSTTYYQEKLIHSFDGIGKYYLGREIAQVMGHQAMLWLERPSREVEERPQLLVESLDLKPTDIVADIGAGTGYLSFKMANLVPQGKVLAVDIQPEMLEVINFLIREDRVNNVETIVGEIDNPNLAENSIDLALMVDAYHEFAYPREMMAGIVKALKPEGKVVLVEYRGENLFIPIKPLHKMTQKQTKKEMAAVGLKWQQTKEILPQQHLMVFQK